MQTRPQLDPLKHFLSKIVGKAAVWKDVASSIRALDEGTLHALNAHIKASPSASLEHLKRVGIEFPGSDLGSVSQCAHCSDFALTSKLVKCCGAGCQILSHSACRPDAERRVDNWRCAQCLDALPCLVCHEAHAPCIRREPGKCFVLCDSPHCAGGGHIACFGLTAAPAGRWRCPLCLGQAIPANPNTVERRRNPRRTAAATFAFPQGPRQEPSAPWFDPPPEGAGSDTSGGMTSEESDSDQASDPSYKAPCSRPRGRAPAPASDSPPSPSLNRARADTPEDDGLNSPSLANPTPTGAGPPLPPARDPQAQRALWHTRRRRAPPGVPTRHDTPSDAVRTPALAVRRAAPHPQGEEPGAPFRADQGRTARSLAFCIAWKGQSCYADALIELLTAQVFHAARSYHSLVGTVLDQRLSPTEPVSDLRTSPLDALRESVRLLSLGEMEGEMEGAGHARDKFRIAWPREGSPHEL